jgi:hypothetical protein
MNATRKHEGTRTIETSLYGPIKVTIYWDDLDPNNAGYAYRYTRPDTVQESGAIESETDPWGEIKRWLCG